MLDVDTRDGRVEQVAWRTGDTLVASPPDDGPQIERALRSGNLAAIAAVFLLAGLLGERLAVALQNPWVLGAFALHLSALALSMFGLFQFQLPAALQGDVGEWSNRLPGGRFPGVFLMGGLSALIVGPCVAAPLAGAPVFISQSRDVVIGGLALFSLAAGMSVPLPAARPARSGSRRS